MRQKPTDIAFVLVAPGGQALMLGDGAGGASPISNVEFGVDDSAPTALPNSPLTAGTYRPAAYFAGSNFAPPGPGTSYGNPGPAAAGMATLASAFNGAGANGVWNLFVRNFGGANTGQFGAGWSLEVSPSPPPVITPVPPSPSTVPDGAAQGKKKKCKKPGKKPSKKRCKKKRKR